MRVRAQPTMQAREKGDSMIGKERAVEKRMAYKRTRTRTHTQTHQSTLLQMHSETILVHKYYTHKICRQQTREHLNIGLAFIFEYIRHTHAHKYGADKRPPEHHKRHTNRALPLAQLSKL